MAASNGKHVPDDWQAEIFACPDEACHHILLARDVVGRPPCSGQIHKRTGRYPKIDRLVVGIKERLG